ncbi:MAG: leucine-rich repeat protein [Bacteroidales bacterium]|nr:leucine-rich repeat protein [Bacteroidales bacterium]
MKIRHLLSFLAATALSVTANAADIYDGESGNCNYYFTEEGTVLNIVAKDGTDGTMASYESKPSPFGGNENIKTVNFDGVTSIGAKAFNGCSQIESVTFSEGTQLKSIGSFAFWRCNALKSISIPTSVTAIDNYAFCGCNSLASVNIPDGIETIGEETFMNCAITSITIPASVTSIGERAFSGCNLQSVVFAEGSKLVSIGEQAFIFCYKLSSISLPEGLTTIGSNAFSSTPLSMVILPESVVTVGEGAFYNLANNSAIFVPKTKEELNLDGCAISYLTTVYYSDSEGWGESGNCLWYLSEDGALLNITARPGTDGTMANYETGESPFYGNANISQVKLNGVSAIGSNAFEGCTGITTMLLPQSVANVGNDAFEGCSALTTVIADNTKENLNLVDASIDADASIYYEGEFHKVALRDENYEYTAEPGNIIYTADNMLYVVDGATIRASFPEPEIAVLFTASPADGFTTDNGLSPTVFSNITADITIAPTFGFYPNDETKTAAIGGYYTPEHIVIPSQVTINGEEYQVTSISNYAFQYNYDLKSVVIPEGVTEIGESAFRDCDALQSVVIPKGVTTIGDHAFEYCRSLQSVVIPEGVTTIGNRAFYECEALESVVIPEGVTTISDYAFAYCHSLQSVIIPEGVTTIGNSAFYNCEALESVVIPDGVTYIDRDAFSGCSSLDTIFVESTNTDLFRSDGYGSNYNDYYTTICYKGTDFDYHVVLPEGAEATAEEGVIVGKSGNMVFVKAGAEITLSDMNGYVYVVASGEAELTGKTLSAINSDVEIGTRKLITHAAISIATIAEQTYTGEEITPAVDIADDVTPLAEKTDFTVEYSNNVNAGTATVTITGIGNYTGETEVTFTIGKATPEFEEIESQVIESTQTLADVTLPEGYSFVNAEQTLNLGENTVALNYNPDPVNYETVSGNMLVIVTKATVTGVQDAQNAKSQNVKKYVENGSLIIEVDGVKYDITGKVVK